MAVTEGFVPVNGNTSAASSQQGLYFHAHREAMRKEKQGKGALVQSTNVKGRSNKLDVTNE